MILRLVVPEDSEEKEMKVVDDEGCQTKDYPFDSVPLILFKIHRKVFYRQNYLRPTIHRFLLMLFRTRSSHLRRRVGKWDK